MDTVLADFYGAFPYPWRPMRFDVLADPLFHTRFLRQDLGDFHAERVPPVRSVWVAGCGTNQAVLTALRFPDAEVLGTDAAAAALEVGAGNAAALGLTNLTLRQEDIATAAHTDRFDYIVCTGVIHHNPDPAACLAALSRALRRDGVLELMVYNAYHRLAPVAFRAALRLFGDDPATVRPDRRLDLGRRLAAAVPPGSILATELSGYENPAEAAWADMWINPCENGYTVADLATMAAAAGLVLETPTPNGFGETAGSVGSAGWRLDLADDDLRDRFAALDDVARWQAVNLLRYDNAPMLWYYLGHGPRTTEAERAVAFLATGFRPNRTERGGYVLGDDGEYRRTARITPFPAGRPPADARAVYDAADGRPMREVLAGLGIEATPDVVHRLRIQLTTSAYPFLVAE